MKLKNYKLLFFVLPLTVSLTACNKGEQLKAVEEFSLTSENVKESSFLIIGDIDDSCIRREEIKNQKLSMVNQPVTDEKGDPIFPLINIRERCEKWNPVVVQTNQINGTLISYMQSLGQLASGNTVTFTENTQTLGNSVNDFSKALGATNISVSEEQQQAGVKVVNSLLNLWSSQFRYKNLKPAIICTDPYFADYVSLLGEIIDKVYLKIQLRQEEDAIKSRYNNAYKIALRTSRSNPAVLGSTIVDLQNDYKQQIGDLDKRKQAAIAYGGFLAQTQGLHHALANNFRGQATDAEIESLCENYFSLESTNPVTGDASPQQLNKATELIKDYQKKVNPLINKINQSQSIKK